MAFRSVGDYWHEFDALYNEDDDCSVLAGLAGPSLSQLPLAPPIGHYAFSAAAAACAPSSGSEKRLVSSYSGYLSPFTNQEAADWDGPEPFGSAPPQPSSPGTTNAWATGGDGGKFEFLWPGGQVLEQDPAPAISHNPAPRILKRPRKQNHSCDPCRAGKRACDLPPKVAIQVQDSKALATPCTMCRMRGAECTVAWLMTRQNSRLDQKRASPRPGSPSSVKTSRRSKSATGKLTANEACILDAVGPVATTSEQVLARQVVLRETCSQRLYLYIDMVDSPLVKSLSQDCIPPCYSSGMKALSDLSSNRHLAPLLHRVLSKFGDCWQIHITSWTSPSASPTPHLFLAVSLLDMFLQQSGFTPSSASSRDTALHETCKWVAIATASQLGVQRQGPADTGATCSQAWDIAFEAWQKAKQLLFENIAATKSFRMALSLLLFGAILPPTGGGDRGSSSIFEEDMAYAQREGLQRLQGLCAEARVHLLGRSKATLQPDVRDLIFEIIGALEWLVAMVHSPAVVTSRTHIPMAIPLFYSKEVEESIIARARADSHSVTAMWDRGISDTIMARVVSHAGSISVLMWRALALLTMAIETLETDEVDYEELYRLYTTMTTLIDIWRSKFGLMNETTAKSLQRSRPDILRSVYFCSMDVDLAILLFYDLVHALETQLLQTETLPSPSPANERLCCALQAGTAYHKNQRLTSAMQISYVALASQGMSSPELPGKSGLKEIIHDIGAHLVSWTMSLSATLWS